MYQKRSKKRTNLEGFIQEFDFGCTGVLVSPVNSYDKLDPVSMLESEISNLNKDNHNMIICKGISIFLNMNLINDLNYLISFTELYFFFRPVLASVFNAAAEGITFSNCAKVAINGLEKRGMVKNCIKILQVGFKPNIHRQMVKSLNFYLFKANRNSSL